MGDLATFLHALFDGKLIPASGLEAMLPSEGDDYGLGIARFDLGVPMYGHTGSVPGYNSGMIIVRRQATSSWSRTMTTSSTRPDSVPA